MRKMLTECEGAGARHLILLTPAGLTPFAARELLEIAANDRGDVEIFRKQDLCMPITHHRLVPRHTPLSSSEKKQFLAELSCKQSVLPKLKESDPVARYLHLQPGTVVKIDRRIGALESEPYFRLVV